MSSSEHVARWVGDVGPHTPLRKAARRILRARLKAVERAVRAARRTARERDVHQLRVACRRADAVLAALRDVIRISRVEKARKWIRAVRRSAGRVREHDVHLAGLAALFPPVTSEHEPTTVDASIAAVPLESAAPATLAGEYVRDRLLHEREDALDAFLTTLDDLDLPRFRVLRKRLVRSLKRARVRLPDSARRANHAMLCDAARTALPRFVDDVLAAAGEDLSNPEHLHALRIKGKALRYGIEVFSSCLDHATIVEAYPVATELQERLGRINDGYELLRVLDDVMTDLGGTQLQQRDHAHELGGLLAGVLELQSRVRAMIESSRHEFTAWWRATLSTDVLGRLERTTARLTVNNTRDAPDDAPAAAQRAAHPPATITAPGQQHAQAIERRPIVTPRQRETALIEVRLKSRPLDDVIESIRAGQEREP